MRQHCKRPNTRPTKHHAQMLLGEMIRRFSVTHTFSARSVKGWSMENRTSVDVLAVVEVEVRKRWFMILNRRYPYTLAMTILHARPEKHYSPNTVLTWNVAVPTPSVGAAVDNFAVKTEFVVTRRYMTKEEAQAEANAILGKQSRVVAKLRKLVDAEAEEAT